ncbi:MAG: TolC family protein [Elusimicrobiota bacterium]
MIVSQFLSLALLFNAWGSAQESEIATFNARISSGTITLATVLDIARMNNLELKASRQAWVAAQERPAEVSAFDDPSLSVSHMLAGPAIQTTAGPMMNQFSISQKIPFWGKRALRGQAASLGAEVAHQAFRAKSLEIMDRAVRAYCELYYLDQAVAIIADQRSVLTRFARVVDKKYAVGQAPQAAAFRAVVELSKLENDLVSAEERRTSAQAGLNALLDRLPRAALGRPEAPKPPDFHWDTEVLIREALAQRPEIQALQALKGQRDAERRLAIRKYFPDFVLGYQYGEIGSGTTAIPYSGQDSQALVIGINLPIWIKKENAAARRSQANLAASEFGLENMIDETRYQAEDLSVKADTAARLFKLYEGTVLPEARAALDSNESAYEAGTAGFLDLLDSERTLLKFDLEQERHRTDYTIAVADLERVIGEPLDHAEGESK